MTNILITKKQLTKNIKLTFPRLNKPEKYADLILMAVKLRADNRTKAVKRKLFLESGEIPASIFDAAYLKYDILVARRNADKTLAISSQRAGLLFASGHALSVLATELYLLYQQISEDNNLRIIVCKILNLSIKSNNTSIQSKIENGLYLAQVGTYKKVYDGIRKRGFMPKGYMSMSVTTLPASLYYLSDLSKSILRSTTKDRR